MLYILELLENKIVATAVISWAIAQLIKIFLELISNGKVDWELMFASGGMPSSHSSFVCSMAMAVGFEMGFNSAVFAVAFVVALVVMYDATGVRREAGSHAAIINKLLENLNIRIDEKLKELIGHTPIQVCAGAVLGIVVAIIGNALF